MSLFDSWVMSVLVWLMSVFVLGVSVSLFVRKWWSFGVFGKGLLVLGRICRIICLSCVLCDVLMMCLGVMLVIDVFWIV